MDETEPESLPPDVTIYTPGDRNICFFIQEKEFLKMDKNGIALNRENFPHWKPNDFVQAFIEILEKSFAVKFVNVAELEEEKIEPEEPIEFIPLCPQCGNWNPEAGRVLQIKRNCDKCGKYANVGSIGTLTRKNRLSILLE